MLFEVKTLAQGRISSCVIDAINRDDALRQAAARALRPIGVKEKRTGLPRIGGRRARRYDDLLFVQELAALLDAGLSVIEAIDVLQERERVPVSNGVLAQLSDRLREGLSCSGALETQPEAFPDLLVGMVRSAERTGNLKEALVRYIDYRRRLDSLRNKVVSAAIYPSMLILVAIAVTAFLGGYVVPRFATVYKGTGRSIPWASQMLLQWGTFVSEHGSIVVISFVALAVLAMIGWKTLSQRGGLLSLVRFLPGISDQVRTYELSRLYLTIGMLLDSGLAIMPVLSLAERGQPPHLRGALREAGAAIRIGDRLSAAFDRAGLITPVGMRMLRVGEESGRQGEMMTRAAKFHDEETSRWIDRFSRVVEPALMVSIGLIIGVIVVLLYMPIFDLAGSLR